jgi:TRAP transporter 4TM/12TM fusion protein
MNRELYGYWGRAIRLIAIAFAFFHLYTGAFGVLPHMRQRAIHVMFGLILAFATLSPIKRKKPETTIPIWDLICIFITIVGCITVYVKYIDYLTYIGESNIWDIVIGIATSVLIIEAGRRTVGWNFPIITIAMILYALCGEYIPGEWGHRGFSFEYVIQTLYQMDKGIWGPITGVSASLVSMFILFGAVLQFTGGGETFKSLAIILTGRFRGGPAMAAVVASALFGTISGSAVANTATTGNFTIPLMKRLGYRPEFAGGVEAAASTGGQIMPPIMASGAFVMAELLGIPYLKICIAALVPAVLYFICMFSSIRFEAIKSNLRAVPREEIPSLREVLTWKRLAPLFIPFAILIIFMAKGYTPYRAGFVAICLSVLIYLLSNFNLEQMLQRTKDIFIALENGARALINIAALCACAQMFVSLLFLTGLGGKFSEAFLNLSGQHLGLALSFTAIVSLILGMGMPSVAAYILAISVVGAPLIMMKIPALNVHLFVFYFAIISATTPPVCVAAFTAATIAGTSWLRVAWVSMRIAIVKYFMPVLFILNPIFLLQGRIGEIIFGIFSAIIGIILITSSLIGFLHAKLSIASRSILLLAGFFLFIPGLRTDLFALLLGIAGSISIYFDYRKLRSQNLAVGLRE